MVNHMTGKTGSPVTWEPGKRIGQAAYGCYVALFAAVYYAFFYYCNKYLNVIVEDLIHFRFSEPVKIAAVLSAACICVWLLFFAATVWRGRDIGFRKWQSVIFYLLPSMPRFFEMLFAFDLTNQWVEPLSTALCLVVSLLFLYLPTGWCFQRKAVR